MKSARVGDAMAGTARCAVQSAWRACRRANDHHLTTPFGRRSAASLPIT